MFAANNLTHHTHHPHCLLRPSPFYIALHHPALSSPTLSRPVIVPALHGHRQCEPNNFGELVVDANVHDWQFAPMEGSDGVIACANTTVEVRGCTAACALSHAAPSLAASQPARLPATLCSHPPACQSVILSASNHNHSPTSLPPLPPPPPCPELRADIVARLKATGALPLDAPATLVRLRDKVPSPSPPQPSLPHRAPSLIPRRPHHPLLARQGDAGAGEDLPPAHHDGAERGAPAGRQSHLRPGAEPYLPRLFSTVSGPIEALLKCPTRPRMQCR